MDSTDALVRMATAGLLEVPELARHPRILERFATDVARCGVVGEDSLLKLLFLAVTSRLLEKPVSVAVKGPSSGGKSYTIDQVLSFFPTTAYYVLSAMSERALAYSSEPLSHRMLVIYEAAGLASDIASYLVRSLLSEGRVRYETVDRTKEGLRARLIEREGPTGLLVTTTAIRLHPENETRLLSVVVDDTPEQTRAVLRGLAAEDRDHHVDVSAWHALQTWLEGGEHRVTVPFADQLAELIPPVAVRLRRDFRAVLSLIRSHAVLQQELRERDVDGCVVATLEDYVTVRGLVADIVSEAVEATVSPTIRETVEAVASLAVGRSDGVSVADVGAAMGLDKSAASRRVRAATHLGFLNNLEERPGRRARLVLGEALPEEVDLLPAVEALRNRCTVAGGSEGVLRDGLTSAGGRSPRGHEGRPSGRLRLEGVGDGRDTSP